MHLRQRRHWTTLLAFAVLAASLSCGDERTPTAPRLRPAAPNASIWDGANSGNPNVFFLPPLVANPASSPTFRANPFQAGLPVEIEVACLTPAAGFSCSGRGLPRTATKVSLTDEQYMLNWDTRAPGFDAGFTFRINVWIGSTNVAFADVLLMSNANPKNRNTNDDIPLSDGRTMPIKVRVQQGWNCVNQAQCVTQVVTNTPPAGETYTKVLTPGGVSALFAPANWFDTQGGTIKQVLVTIEDVTNQVSTSNGGPGCSLGKTVMLTNEHCVKFTVDPKVVISTLPGNPVIVATCVDGVTGLHKQLLKYDDNEVPEFLVNVTPPSPFVCQEGTGGLSASPATHGLLNLASRIGRAIKDFVTPTTAYAIDLGVGGGLDAGTTCCSLIAFAQPITMTNVSPLTQIASVNQSAPEQVQITTVHDGVVGVEGQTVTCQVLSGGGTVGTPAATDAKGVTTCPWALGPNPGTNQLLVTAQGIDDCGRFTEECAGIFAAETDPRTGLPVKVRLNRTVIFTAEAVAPSLLIACSNDAVVGDLLDRGFYVPNYPGVSLSRATLGFSAVTAGNYTFSLTARRGAYDGQVIGVANATVALANGGNSFTPATFVFPTPYPGIVSGSTVTFALSQIDGPSRVSVFYEVPSNGDTTCPVTETEGTTAPLDTKRRDGVIIQIQGATQPVVIR